MHCCRVCPLHQESELPLRPDNRSRLEAGQQGETERPGSSAGKSIKVPGSVHLMWLRRSPRPSVILVRCASKGRGC